MSVSADVSIVISASHDCTLKTWHLSPREPDAPKAPRIISKTDSTVTLSWIAPPSFNEDITAYSLQWRLGLRQPWVPNPPLSIPPHYRSKILRNLFSSTTYQFRLRAENRMGCSAWSEPSLQVCTVYLDYSSRFILLLYRFALTLAFLAHQNN